MKRGKRFFTQIQKAERPYEYWIAHSEEWRGEKEDRPAVKDFLTRFEMMRPSGTVGDPDALNRFAFHAEEGDFDLIYCDDDVVKNGIRTDPFFRPEYSPETFESYRYIPGLTAVRKEILDEYGEDFIRHIRPEKILHIPEVLCHFVKERPSDGYDAACGGEVPEAEDTVSIIILSKDHPEMLQRCVDSILASDPPKGTEIIAVDNGSSPENRKLYRKLQKENRIEYIQKTCEFNFSALCNLGAGMAKGAFLIFLNDDVEIPRVSKHFIQRLLGQAKKDHAGAVGMKLLYPESRNIQHCGICLQKSGPSHMLCGLPDEEEHYSGFNRKTVNVTAVTGACLCIRKTLFDRVRGFDENLPLAYNDVDLCIRLMNRGFINICINGMYLYHYESATRKKDTHDRSAYEKLKSYREYFAGRHRDFISKKDPFLNPNLTDKRADMSIDVDQDWEESGIEIEPERLEGSIIRVKKGLVCNSDITAYRLSDAYLNEDFFEASGWIFFRRKKVSDYSPAILVSSGDRYVVFGAARTFRKDVEKVFKRKKDACMSGFYTRVSRKVLELEGFSGHMDVTPVLKDKRGRIYACEQRN